MAIPLNKIQIVNQCMNLLGRSPVVEASDDSYSIVIDARVDDDITYLLGEHQWYFASTYFESTSPDVFNPSPDWQNAFTLPADFLLVINMRSAPQYTIMGNKLLTNGNFVQYYYVANTNDYTLLPPWFVKALVYYTCSQVAPELTQNESLSRDLYSSFLLEMGKAKMKNVMAVPIYAAPGNPYDRGGLGSVL